MAVSNTWNKSYEDQLRSFVTVGLGTNELKTYIDPLMHNI